MASDGQGAAARTPPSENERTSGVIPAPSWLGKRVGRFKIVALLGQGAMGRVFRCEDTALHRQVALKVISKSSKGGDLASVERFVREARSAATLEHPNVVQIYEVNETGNICYITMELVEGGSLYDLVKAAGPMDVVRACQLVAEAGEALAHAHALGIIHRDVKPANLLLTRAGRCKVADFGLCRIDDPNDAGSMSAPTESVGTPQFIAPEITRGGFASPRSDVYSLGATLWYLLTGSPPFVASTAKEMLKMHSDAPLPDLAKLRPELPATLIAAIYKSMAKTPAERFHSADQFAKALRLHTIPVGGGSEVRAGSVSMSIPTHHESSPPTTATRARSSAMLWIGATVVGVIVVGLGAWWFLPSPGSSASSPVSNASSAPTPPAPPSSSASSAHPAAAEAPGAAVPSAAPPSSSEVVLANDIRVIMKIAGGDDTARSHKPVTVEGMVSTVQLSKKGKFYRIQFTGVDDDVFRCVYYPERYAIMQERFGGENGDGLSSKRVRIRGEIILRQGVAQIVVRDPDQVEVAK